ncbi:hypothetical protein T440DRAFT_558682 [Plenodomus tracheiphilus IPT5]|uniref:F-box domain-containing protein n=1 Tax=Plenodomus tracheiphilus IPT5 TaxID=1408161 RepID=A0A6A7AUF3_9PLEO|nr:hypothetical protein T440DRAFT_558682 [Plenodomus tracheiphilus IPT5]
MAVLVDLPNEIIHQIYVLAQSTEFSESGRVGYNAKVCHSTLMALCRTSRGLKDIAEDILYQTLEVPWDGKGSLIPLWLLTRTLMSRADLAQKTKKLTVPITPQAAIKLGTPEDQVLKDITDIFPTRVQRMSQKLWAYEVVHTLLCHLPNVETLYFAVIALNVHIFEGHVPPDILGQMRQARVHSVSQSLQASEAQPKAGASSHYALHSKLKAIHICHENMIQLPLQLDLKELGSIFQLSTLQSLTASRRQMVFLPGIPLLRPETTMNLTVVTLLDCSIDAASVSHVCNAATRLQHFTLIIADPLTIHRGTLLGHPQLDQVPHVRQPTPQQTMNALNCRADTHFTKLMKLNVEFDRICAPTELPKSLVSLTLTRMSPTPYLMEEPLYYPQLAKRYEKLIEDRICPSLSYVKLGRFVPFRYDAGRVLDWRHITANRWNDFISDRVYFTDHRYEWRDRYDGGSTKNFELDIWRDDWWSMEFTAWWPKELKMDILAFVHQEAQAWVNS